MIPQNKIPPKQCRMCNNDTIGVMTAQNGPPVYLPNITPDESVLFSRPPHSWNPKMDVENIELIRGGLPRRPVNVLWQFPNQRAVP